MPRPFARFYILRSLLVILASYNAARRARRKISLFLLSVARAGQGHELPPQNRTRLPFSLWRGGIILNKLVAVWADVSFFQTRATCAAHYTQQVITNGLSLRFTTSQLTNITVQPRMLMQCSHHPQCDPSGVFYASWRVS